MKTLIFHPLLRISKIPYYLMAAVLLLILAFQLVPLVLHYFDHTTAVLDAAVWQLFLFSLLAFLVMLVISAYLLSALWRLAGLPHLHFMVSQFKNLSSWQQLSFYYACFALLLLSAVGCLAAVF